MRAQEHEIRKIREYVEGQDREAEVHHAERLASTKILGRPHEIWDVHASTQRYWVITNPTNLYAQEDFKSADTALTFHVGLGVRMAERSRTDLDPDLQDYVSTSWRMYEQAVDAYNSADEAEAYQAVGIRCREALIALARRVAATIPEAPPHAAPKVGDFKSWSALAAENLATGRLRTYLKTLSEKAWDLVVWLQHYESATSWDAELVLDATSHTVSIFGMAFRRKERGLPERCPRCASYRVDEDNDLLDNDPDVQWIENVCSACGHGWDRQIIRWDEETGTWISSVDIDDRSR